MLCLGNGAVSEHTDVLDPPIHNCLLLPYLDSCQLALPCMCLQDLTGNSRAFVTSRLPQVTVSHSNDASSSSNLNFVTAAQMARAQSLTNADVDQARKRASGAWSIAVAAIVIAVVMSIASITLALMAMRKVGAVPAGLARGGNCLR